MKTEEIEAMREEIQYASDNWKFRTRVTIKKLAKYLKIVHPELKVELEPWSCYKDRTWEGSRLRSPGIREYKGYRLKVWDSNGNRILDHNTTETYRRNYDVARWIISYEESK